MLLCASSNGDTTREVRSVPAGEIDRAVVDQLRAAFAAPEVVTRTFKEARAYLWQELLDTGRYASVTELAAALDVDRRCVGRILRLTCLVPDLVEAIVDGRESSGLPLERLCKGLPVVAGGSS